MSVEVLVEQDVEKQFRPVKYRLIRWYATESDTDEEQDEQQDTDDETDTEGDNDA